MSLLEKTDLKYQYSWTTTRNDDPKITGIPDSILLNRQEGYEVLSFINRFAKVQKLTQKIIGLKAERLIKENLPSEIRSHCNITNWLLKNWGNYS